MSSIRMNLCKVVLMVMIFANFISNVVVASDFPKEAQKLVIDILDKPDGCHLKSELGDTIFIHYVGKLADGTEFDSSKTRGYPLDFKLGEGRVIQGWEEGLLNMCEGEQRKLVIPPDLAYGENGSPPKIPKSATVTFHVNLIRIERPYDEL